MSRKKNKIRDPRARVYLIGECGGERSRYGLLTGVRYAHTPSTTGTFCGYVATPTNVRPTPSRGTVGRRGALTSPQTRRPPLLSHRSDDPAHHYRPMVGSPVDRARRRVSTHGRRRSRGNPTIETARKQHSSHFHTRTYNTRARARASPSFGFPRGKGPCADTGFLDVTQHLL